MDDQLYRSLLTLADGGHAPPELLERMLHDPQVLDAYLQIVTLEALLSERIGGLAGVSQDLSDMSAAPSVAVRRAPSPQRNVAPWAMAAAVVLGVALGMSLLLNYAWNRHDRMTRPPQYFATLIDARAAVFEPSDVPTSPGSQLPGGFLRLASGEVDLEFFSGAKVTITGPAVFGVNSAMRGFLERGRLSALCPPAAVGFTVGAPGMTVVDLGTRFEMNVRAGAPSEVKVLDGRVALRVDGSSHIVELGPDRQARFDTATGALELAEVRSPDHATIDDFSTDPDLESGWKWFGYHGSAFHGQFEATWNSTERDVDLRKTRRGESSVLGLSRIAEASPVGSIALTVKELEATGGSWAQIGLMISVDPVPRLLDAAARYELEIRSDDGGKTWFYLVRKAVGHGPGFDLYASKPAPFAGPTRLAIVRNGDGFDFEVNGQVIHSANVYGARVHDAMVHHAITFGGDVEMSATIDDLGLSVARSVEKRTTSRRQLTAPTVVLQHIDQGDFVNLSWPDTNDQFEKGVQR